MAKNKQFERLYFPQPINVFQAVSMKCEPHWHHFTEILYFPPGSADKQTPDICIEQCHYHPKPGDIIFIWSNEMHSIEEISTSSLLGFQFHASLLSELPEFASFSHLFRSHHILSPQDPVLGSLTLALHEKLNCIASLNKGHDSFRGVKELIALYELFILFGNTLRNTFSVKDSEESDTSRTIDKINQACRYITENCDKELSLDTVASMVGFSSCYFSRIFKQTVQCNFVEYLTLQRLKLAQNLLSDSEAAITTVAMESGFRSISTFNRVFQKYKGCSPSEYKKHYLLR